MVVFGREKNAPNTFYASFSPISRCTRARYVHNLDGTVKVIYGKVSGERRLLKLLKFVNIFNNFDWQNEIYTVIPNHECYYFNFRLAAH